MIDRNRNVAGNEASMNSSSRFYRRTFALAAAALLAYALFMILDPFRGPLIWAAFLAFMLYPLHEWLTIRLRHRAGLSAAIITLLAPVAILVPLSSLASLFVAQAGNLLVALQGYAAAYDMNYIGRIESLPIVGPALGWLETTLRIDTARIREWAVSGGENLLRNAATLGGNVVAGAIGTAVAFLLMLVLLFFALRDGESLLERPLRLIPLSPERRADLVRHLAGVTRAVVYGTGVTATLQGFATGVGFAIAGLPSAVVFGVLAGLLSLLPIGGAAIVWVPGVIYLAATAEWGWAIFLLIWGLGVSSGDNLLRPMLVSSRAPVSTLTVFIGVLGGAAAFGTIGLVAGPLVLTLIAALMQYADEAKNDPT